MPITRRDFLFGAALTAAGATAPARLYLRFENESPELCPMEVPVRGLPEAFDGFRLVLLSDLHGKLFEPEQEPVLELVRQAKPQAVAFVGDAVDNKRGGRDAFLLLADKLLQEAPLLWAPGNHEWYRQDAVGLTRDLEQRGAMVLPGRAASLRKQGQTLYWAGVWDYPGTMANERISRAQIKEAMDQVPDQACVVLLSHRPQLMDLYQEFNVNLALCGHNHGGQIRIPGLGGLGNPRYELFPKYDAGVFLEDPTTMVVTRGLGNSGFPLRINNRPEVAVLTLRSLASEAVQG